MGAAVTSPVLDHVIATIGPASAAHAELARTRAGAMGPLAALAIRLAGAQHAVYLRVSRRALVVVACDHGVGAPGIDLGAEHPTSVALRALAGDAPLLGLARAAGATLMTVDAGCAGTGLPDDVIRLGLAPTADATAGPAMTVADAIAGLEAGAALAVALADDGVDVIGVGRLGLGAEVSAPAVIAALTGGDPARLAAPGDGEAASRLAAVGGSPLEILARIGGGDIAVVAGLVLAAASLTMPVVLDDHVTLAAALVAARLAPDAAGYVIASQSGSIPGARAALDALGLIPLVSAGIGHGEGAGAAMAMSLITSAAALLAGS